MRTIPPNEQAMRAIGFHDLLNDKKRIAEIREWEEKRVALNDAINLWLKKQDIEVLEAQAKADRGRAAVTLNEANHKAREIIEAARKEAARLLEERRADLEARDLALTEKTAAVAKERRELAEAKEAAEASREVAEDTTAAARVREAGAAELQAQFQEKLSAVQAIAGAA